MPTITFSATSARRLRFPTGWERRWRWLPNGFYVADDGPGVPADERDQVFEFGHSGGDGTGSGLAIVRSIAEAHDWTVSLTDSESGGARFEFTGVEFVE